jgi:hypothetical protein
MNKKVPSELKLTREERISIPPPDSERRMAIRCADWDRIKNNIYRISEPISFLRVVYSIIYGAAATAGLTLIPLAFTEGLPSWIIPLYICISFFGFLCATVFLLLDRKTRSNRVDETFNIARDMDEIERAHKV